MNIISVSNSLDPDQARHFVGPDLDPILCKGYQQTTLLEKELTLYHTSIGELKIEPTH